MSILEEIKENLIENLKLKVKIYDFKEKRLLNTNEINHILKDIMLIKNDEIEFKSTKDYYVSQFLNSKDIKNNDIFEGDIILLRFIDKRTNKKEELEIGITILDEQEVMLPMVTTIENRMYNFGHYLKEKELEILKIGNIVESEELLENFFKANDLQININLKKNNLECKSDLSLDEMEKQLKEVKKQLFGNYDF